MMILAKKFWTGFAGLNGFIAVAMGAVAAHAIADAHAAEMVQKASLYQLIHAVALLALSGRQGKIFVLARWAFGGGIILFCGTLYLRALSGWVAATHLAPAGGIGLMSGWLLVALACYKEE